VTRPIRIVVIDPHPIFREGVIRTIERAPDLMLVGQGETTGDAMRAVEETSPDILIIDISADGGIAQLNAMSGRCPGLKIIILTALDDVLSVGKALAIGVQGYVLKGVTGLELIDAIKTVDGGQPVVTSELASRLLVEGKGGPLLMLRQTKSHAPLSSRERQVLDQISRGLTNKEIADELGVKVKTIKYYLTQVFRKLKVTNRLQAIQAAQKADSD